MFQLTFSDQSMAEVNALEHVGQLELMEKVEQQQEVPHQVEHKKVMGNWGYEEMSKKMIILD